MNEDEVFWENLSLLFGLLSPAERRILNGCMRLCEEHRIGFTDALTLADTDPQCLPPEVYWCLRRADESGIWERASALFENQNRHSS